MSLFNSLLTKQFPKIEEAKKQIQEVYLSDDRPWVVGYSGGKDSTVVAQLVFDALSELPHEKLHKKIYVISSDTLVETPLIISSINSTLHRIQEKALEAGLPIETHKVKPAPEKSFWANIIGKGYPSPNQKFRWCTDRLKIDPANQFITDKVSKFGEVIMVLGVRDDESATRANVMKSHTVEGKILMRHSTLSNAFVYAPIRNFELDDVWNYLLNNESPWGDDNFALHKLYQDSSSGECPLVVDKTVKESAGSCGNSRFGCWVCTVVTEDKALNGFIESGEDWMRPLLEFRNWLAEIRDVRTYRQKYRMNGQIYFKEARIEVIDGIDYVIIPKKGRVAAVKTPLAEYTIIDKSDVKAYLFENKIDLSTGQEFKLLVRDEAKLMQFGLGPFTLEARSEILRKLLETQRDLIHPQDPNFELIREDELRVIRRYWLENGDWEDRVPKIYKEVTGVDLDWEMNDAPLFDQEQLTDLELLCEKYKVDFKLLKQLISIEREYNGFNVRRGLFQDIEKVLKQDYLHL
ncbi:DNA phosphorothioation system sulfurtransferase DndC [Fictibacillus nanhaiensis]|uniref:DNA phosphorothioation system sulfurtransferase DndC n=1 Tax=Fictibacillus nanhaiensis TaxID=742169 RepID=UPI001C96EA6E|nr:DNA phosphorothioation system sulfurtransferase DndC [Fictibacillus nanhaiensis]MBY6036640.1 DNA phosphorothioation system sulfurtransferase DndC [Fictibacillus nanhaiensis]